jgi:hypothetical protein
MMASPRSTLAMPSQSLIFSCLVEELTAVLKSASLRYLAGVSSPSSEDSEDSAQRRKRRKVRIQCGMKCTYEHACKKDDRPFRLANGSQVIQSVHTVL